MSCSQNSLRIQVLLLTTVGILMCTGRWQITQTPVGTGRYTHRYSPYTQHQKLICAVEEYKTYRHVTYFNLIPKLLVCMSLRPRVYNNGITSSTSTSFTFSLTTLILEDLSYLVFGHKTRNICPRAQYRRRTHTLRQKRMPALRNGQSAAGEATLDVHRCC